MISKLEQRASLADITLKDFPNDSLCLKEYSLWCQACKRWMNTHKGNLQSYLNKQRHKDNLFNWNKKKRKIKLSFPLKKVPYIL